jgi:hypothetical protein
MTVNAALLFKFSGTTSPAAAETTAMHGSRRILLSHHCQPG